MDFLATKIKKLKSYAVKPVDEGEIKLNAQENPYPVHPDVRCRINDILNSIELNRYPAPGYRRLKKLIADYCNILPNNILAGNGSDELILTILIACGGRNKVVVSPAPTFAMYKILSELTDTKFRDIPLDFDFKLPVREILDENPDIIFIAYPNNPTGNCFFKGEIKEILKHSKGLIVIDEAYFEFSGKTFMNEIKSYPNLLILRTFSKAFSLAGIRAGYMAGNPELMKSLRKAQLPYNLSIINQKIMETVLEDRKKVLRTVRKLISSREKMYNELLKIEGIIPYPSEANFILMKINKINKIFKVLKDNKIGVREFNSPGLREYLRVTVGTEEENKKFIDTLKSVKGKA